MYKTFKKVVKSLVPKAFLVKNEHWIRRLTYMFYKGKDYQCNICTASLSRFVELDTGDLLCPKCGSLPRTRRLWDYLQPFLKKGSHILHFSPSRVLFRKLKSLKELEYFSTDFEDEFLADQKLDIRNTGLNDNHFDLIICFHVLEHIDEDQNAMAELYRILKPGGTCLIQTPFKEGEIYENPSILSPYDREKHFGQRDHVRIYSVSGLQDRLEKAGFKVLAKQFKNETDQVNGFKHKETVLFCRK